MAISLPYLLLRPFHLQSPRLRPPVPRRKIIRDRANSPPCHGPAAAVFSAVWRSSSSALHSCCPITAAVNFKACSFIGGRSSLLFSDSSSSTNALPAVTKLAPPALLQAKSS